MKAATVTLADYKAALRISIHAAREGGDVTGYHYTNGVDISIHAAREGGDAAIAVPVLGIADFNPRRP